MATPRVAFYVRVSTSAQTTENQKFDLERVAAGRGWTIVSTFEDDGISGSRARCDRPALDALLKGAVRGEFDLIAVWSIDRLGRSLQHLVETVNELRAVGVDLYVHQQAIDTSSPAGKLTFSIFGALAEYERELIRERVRCGIDRARRHGVKLGRPTNLNPAVRAAIVALHQKEIPIRKIAAQLRVGTATVYNVLRDAPHQPAPRIRLDSGNGFGTLQNPPNAMS
jgi:DNA invertase Pin-like site-specific DNA recombinase